MKKTSFKINKDILVLVCMSTLGVLGVFFLYNKTIKRPQFEIGVLIDKNNIAEGEIRRKEMMQAEQKKFNNEQLDIESKTLKFRELIPYKVDTTEFVRLLENFSEEYFSEYKLRELRVDILPLEKVEDSYYRRQFNISCQGRYVDIIKFFNLLQRAKYILNIEALSIGRNSEVVPLVETNFRISIIQSSGEE